MKFNERHKPIGDELIYVAGKGLDEEDIVKDFQPDTVESYYGMIGVDDPDTVGEDSNSPKSIVGTMPYLPEAANETAVFGARKDNLRTSSIRGVTAGDKSTK